MANPPQVPAIGPPDRQFIELNDFTPGIFGDMHASTSATQYTSDATLKGAYPRNGAARVEGTDRCHADKSGALVPLPKAQRVGVADGIGPSAPLQPNRAYRYVLDAQSAFEVTDTGQQGSGFVDQSVYRPTQIMWGYWAQQVSSAAYGPFVVGREYRPWLAYPYQAEAAQDFLFSRINGTTAGIGAGVYPLPIGSLAKSRFYIGNTDWGSISDTYISFPTNSSNSLTVPDAAPLRITGDITVVVRILPDAWVPTGDTCLVGKFNVVGAGGIDGWLFELLANGLLRFRWSNDGTTQINMVSSVVTGLANGFAKYLAVTFDVDNGAAGKSARFWTSDDGSTFTQLGATQTTAGVTTIFASTGIIRFGQPFGPNYQGRLYNCSVRAGINGAGLVGGAEVFGFDDADYGTSPGAIASFVTRTSHTVTFVRSSSAFAVVGGAGSIGTTFTPESAYPVTACLAASPFGRWGLGNRMDTSATSLRAWYYGAQPGTFDFTWANYSPAIGAGGLGTCAMAMSWHNPAIPVIPQSSSLTDWYYHYNEENYDSIADKVTNGPWNPYMMISHQGRIIMPDRRRTQPAFTTMVDNPSKAYGYFDDLLWYSDYALPMQSPFINTATGGSIPYAANGDFPICTQHQFNRLLVAEDDVSDVGTIGVTSVDQVLIVKHHTGGAMISGDLDNPTIRRLPFIESTGGVICKGAHSPIGFVYGSNNGIFVWAGGDSTEKLSKQIDGFFWDHTDGSQFEQYAGSRGRMVYWSRFVCIPNNFAYDVDTESWWRFQVTDLLPHSASMAPYNCYDKDDEGTLYAFPYRNVWPTTVSLYTFPTAPTNLNCMTVPNAGMTAPTKLDVRFVIGDINSGSTDREIVGQYDATGNQRCWSISLDTTDHLVLRMSTDGATDTTTATSTAVVSTLNTPVAVRVMWNKDLGANHIVFYTKALAATNGAPERHVPALLRSNADWVTLQSFTGPTVALFNSSAPIRMGNRGAAFNAPFIGRLYGMFVKTSYVNPADTNNFDPNFSYSYQDLPVNTAATSFTASSGQTVTVTRAGAGPVLAQSYVAPPIPVWHTFNERVLDNEYNWSGHPLVETRGRVFSFQSLELVVTGKVDASPITIDVTLSGFNQAGAPVTPVVTTFTLANSAEPQLLAKDIVGNFLAQYVTVKIHALATTTTVPAPKIHAVRLGYRERARTPRQG